MRIPITLRLDTDLLVAAQRDSRTLTNFIEVAVGKRLGMTGLGQEHAACVHDQDTTASNARSLCDEHPTPTAGRQRSGGGDEQR